MNEPKVVEQDMMAKLELLDPYPDPQDHDNIQRLIQAIIDAKDTQRYFQGIKILGSGSYAVCLEMAITGIVLPLAVKIYTRKVYTGFREYNVGRLLNILRRELPNFVYSYDSFKASQPWIALSNVGGYAPFWNLTTGQYVHIVQEYVPGVHIDDLLKTLTPEAAIMILAQIFLALQRAFELCQFTHYDLHTANILVQTLDTPETLVYNFRDISYSLTTKYRCVILDLGFSYAQTAKELHPSSKMGSRSWPFFDFYKLVAILTILSHETDRAIAPFFKNVLSEILTGEEVADIMTNKTLYNQRFELDRKYSAHADYTHLDFIKVLARHQTQPILAISSPRATISGPAKEWPFRKHPELPSLAYLQRLQKSGIDIPEAAIKSITTAAEERWYKYREDILVELARPLVYSLRCLASLVQVRSWLDQQDRLLTALDNSAEKAELARRLTEDWVEHFEEFEDELDLEMVPIFAYLKK